MFRRMIRGRKEEKERRDTEDGGRKGRGERRRKRGRRKETERREEEQEWRKRGD